MVLHHSYRIAVHDDWTVRSKMGSVSGRMVDSEKPLKLGHPIACRRPPMPYDLYLDRRKDRFDRVISQFKSGG